MKPFFYMPLLGLVLLVVALIYGLIHVKDTSNTPLQYKAIPSFDLPTISDAALRFNSTQLQGQPFILNFFASWCITCRYEHPLLMALKEQYNIPIYGISYRDAPANTRKWLKKHGNPYDIVGIDNNGHTAIDFGLIGVPETYVVNKEGTILLRYAGALTQSVITEDILPLLIDKSTIKPLHLP